MNIGYLYPPGWVYIPHGRRLLILSETADAGTGEYAVLTWTVERGR
jgi:hypothetical protein